jgi:alpha-tubulin suppressor-like RCC1 family protein
MVPSAFARTRGRDSSAWFTQLVMRGAVLAWGCAAATAASAQSPLSGVVAIDAGERHTCVLTNAGQVKCWGDNQLGPVGVAPAGGTVSMAVTVPGIEGATAISSWDEYTCARVAGGAMKCWGHNGFGILGGQTNLPTAQPVPVDVIGLSGLGDIAAGFANTCAVTAQGGVTCWGAADYCLLARGVPVCIHTPSPMVPGAVQGLSGPVEQVEVSNAHACALISDGTVMCWGMYHSGVFDSKGDHPLPATRAGVSGAYDLSTGSGHVCVLVDEGRMRCWGAVGGSDPPTGQPSDIVGLSSGVLKMDTGYAHDCGLMAVDGTVRCWGSNFRGQLGFADLQPRLFPTEAVPGLTGAVDIAVGGTFTCAITATGGVVCWGQDHVNQLGNGPPAQNSAAPVVVLELDDLMLRDGFEDF